MPGLGTRAPRGTTPLWTCQSALKPRRPHAPCGERAPPPTAATGRDRSHGGRAKSAGHQSYCVGPTRPPPPPSGRGHGPAWARPGAPGGRLVGGAPSPPCASDASGRRVSLRLRAGAPGVTCSEEQAQAHGAGLWASPSGFLQCSAGRRPPPASLNTGLPGHHARRAPGQGRRLSWGRGRGQPMAPRLHSQTQRLLRGTNGRAGADPGTRAEPSAAPPPSQGGLVAQGSPV